MNFLKNKFGGKDAPPSAAVKTGLITNANNVPLMDKSDRADEDAGTRDSDDGNEFLTFDLATDGASKRVNVVRDSTLQQIGKQIRQLEADCKAADDQKIKEWENDDAKNYRNSIKKLGEEIDVLQKRIKSEVSNGFDHIQQLENLLESHITKQDEIKRKLYFPTSNIALGNGGVYFAMDDFWLEHASGSFELKLSPGHVHGEMPKICLALDGSSLSESVDGGEAGGVSIRLKIGGFKLKGDMGKGIPSLSLDYIKVTTTVRIRIILTFDKKKNAWTSSAQDFKVDILYFKGPFGLNRGVVVAALTVALPFIRRNILAGLPPELGLFIATIPAPLIIKGEFNILGVVLKQMSHGMYKSSDMCAVIGYTSDQLLSFIGIQKSLERPQLIKSMEDLLQYRKIGINHAEQWQKICALWGDASVLYFDLSPSSNRSASDVPFSFDRLLKGAAEVLKNPLTVNFSLHKFCGSIRFHKILENVQKRVERWHLELTESDLLVNKPELVFLMNKVQNRLESARETLQQLKQNLDFINIKLAGHITSGPEGKISLIIQNLVAQAPVAVWSTLPRDLTGGWLTPVPFIIAMQAEEDGSLEVNLEHFGSSELMILSKYMTRKGSGADYDANSNETGSRTGNTVSRRRANGSVSVIPAGNDVAAIVAAATNCMQGAADDAMDKAGKVYVVPEVGSTLDETSRLTSKIILSASDKIAAWTTDRQTTINLGDNTGHHGPRPHFGAGLEKPKQVTIRQEHSYLSSADRLQRELDKIRNQRLAPNEAQSVLRILVLQPHVSITVDQALSLAPGASLFTVRMGPVESNWKPFGFEGDDGAEKRRTSLLRAIPMSHGGSMAGDTRTQVNTGEDSSTNKEKMRRSSLNSAASTPPTAILQLPGLGSPIMVQTSPHVKVLVQVPEIEVDIYLARLFRFIYAYISDVSLLTDTLGYVKPQDKQGLRQHVQFSAFILERLEKYLLIPHLNLSLNLGIKMNQRVEQDDVVFSLDDVGAEHAVDLVGRFNVFDLFKDTCDAITMFKTIYVDETIDV